MFEPHPIAEGPLKGWFSWGNGEDPFETLTGPFGMKMAAGEPIICAFLPELRHLNIGGGVHGGCLATFADFAIFAISYPEIGSSSGVTVSLTVDYVGAARAGVLIRADGEVVRATRDLVFVRGAMRQEDRIIASFSGVIKRAQSKR